MNYQAESDAVEIKRLRDCYAELSKLHQADRRLDEQRIDTLRARVAKLEAALRAAINDVDLSAASARAHAAYEHATANTGLAEELESHAAIYRAALQGG